MEKVKKFKKLPCTVLKIVTFTVWPPRLAFSPRSTSCAPFVEASSPARWPYHVDTASACPVSVSTGHDTSPNTAPAAGDCSARGPTSVSTAFWPKSQITTGKLDPRIHPRRNWYFTYVCQWINRNAAVMNAFSLYVYFAVTGYRCWANDSGEAAEGSTDEICSGATTGALRHYIFCLTIICSVECWCMMTSHQNSYLREVRESQKVFSTLVQAMEKNHKAVVDAIEARKREEEKRVERLVKEIEKEIQELRKESTEPDPHIPVKSDPDDETNQVPVVITLTSFRWCNGIGGWFQSVKNFVHVTQNIVPTTCPSDMKDWSKVAIETDPCIGVTRRALEDIMEKIKVEVNRLSKSGA